MHYEEFVNRVKDKTGIDTYENAVQLVFATLQTLGERLSRTHRSHLAAQLPAELKHSLLSAQAAEGFKLEEFYNRVVARTSMGYPHVVTNTRKVMDVLKEAVSPGELQDNLAEIPEEYKELFGSRSDSPLSSSHLTVTEEEYLKNTKHGTQE